MSDVIQENGRREQVVTTPHIDDAPILSADFQRVHPRQMSTGSLRGAQGLSGDKIIVDSSRERIGVGKLDTSTGDNPTYALTLTRNGIELTDGAITFVSITKDGIILNDGTTDRILIGKDEGGF